MHFEFRTYLTTFCGLNSLRHDIIHEMFTQNVASPAVYASADLKPFDEIFVRYNTGYPDPQDPYIPGLLPKEGLSALYFVNIDEMKSRTMDIEYRNNSVKFLSTAQYDENTFSIHKKSGITSDISSVSLRDVRITPCDSDENTDPTKWGDPAFPDSL